MNIEPLEPRIAPATFTVTSLFDDLSGGTLREAVLAANATPAADTVVFAPELIGSIALDPARNAIPIAGPLTLKGPGLDKITIDASGTTRAFFIDDGDAARFSPATFSGLSIIGGSGGTNGGVIVCFEPLTLAKVIVTGGEVNNEGGGVWVETAGKVTITDTKILDNTALNGGGGLVAKAAGGVTLLRTIISGNEAMLPGASDGGALLESLGAKGSIKIGDSAVTHNTAGGGHGGLFLRVLDGRPIAVTKTTVAFNVADFVGGIYVPSGTLSLANSSVSHNGSANTEGGITLEATAAAKVQNTIFAGNAGSAIFHTSSGALSIGKSQFLENRGPQFGGALYAAGAGVVTVSGSLFSGNTAPDGGGAIFHDGATLVLKSTTFTANTTTVSGGAILGDSGGSIAITGGAFLDNYAGDDGGAIAVGGLAGDGVALSMTGALFRQNSSANSGGAMDVRGDAAVTIKTSSFLENSAFDGGALRFLGNRGTNAIIGSLFRSNVAGDDGGAILWDNSEDLIVSASRFFDNRAQISGGLGGALTFLGAGTVNLAKLQVIGNAAEIGGGIYRAATIVSLTASKVVENFAVTDPNTSGL